MMLNESCKVLKKILDKILMKKELMFSNSPCRGHDDAAHT